MKKVLAFGASNSKNSINKKFAAFVANQVEAAEATIVDLNDYAMPVYSIDIEKESGIPHQAQQFSDLIEQHDAVIISLAEHNSNYTAAFKNLTDWVSRLPGKVWKERDVFLLSTSPGGRGGAGVMNIAMNTFRYSGGNVVANFSLPSFGNNFSEETGIVDNDLKLNFESQLVAFQSSLAQ